MIRSVNEILLLFIKFPISNVAFDHIYFHSMTFTW